MNISLKQYGRELLIGLILLSTYVPSWIWMWDRWFARDSYYSHGILIPFVTGYLIWQQREELRTVPIVRSSKGIILFSIGILIYLFSALFRINFSASLSMLIVFYGIVWYFYGTAIFRKLLFPLLFLLFMIPMPSVLIVNISFKMKLFAATIATMLLKYMGIYAVQEGSIILMKNAHVVVDDVCSGLRSLISLTALGSIFAYWLKGSMLKRIFLFLVTIPIAVVTNVCRVLLLSTISEIWGSKYAEGFVHDATGFLVFGLAFVMLYFAMRLLE